MAARRGSGAAAESDDPGRRGAAIVYTAALDVLTTTPGLHDPHFAADVDDALRRLPLRDQMAVPYLFRRGLLLENGVAELLAECGAIDPETGTLTPLGQWARPELARPPAPRITWADDDVLDLRIDLDRFRPPVWRRVRLPAATTLTELHEIIQILFQWDGDHLHIFTVDGAHYADPFYELDGCADSDQLTLAAALPRPAPAWPTATTSATAGTTPCSSKPAAQPERRTAPPAPAAAATHPSRTGPTTSHHRPARSTSPRWTTAWPSGGRGRDRTCEVTIQRSTAGHGTDERQRGGDVTEQPAGGAHRHWPQPPALHLEAVDLDATDESPQRSAPAGR